MAVKTETKRSRAERKAETARLLAEQIQQNSTGITPKWQRAIETYKRVKALKVLR